ncbi:N-acetyltransferase family protein [Variovorax sp. LT1R16]|uniref:GNAT family N-acetyltransferase n=1 Tax=Variovorax sp. LT1R16 TaxID=3443728 RepID=UPI003F472ED6
MVRIERPQLHIRTATSADAHSLAALSIQVWLSTYATAGVNQAAARFVLSEFSVENFVRLSTDRTVALLVAEEGKALTGYALSRFGCISPLGSGPDTEMATLYVQEPSTHRGVGTALLAKTRAVVHERTGADDIWLSVKADNLRAQAFYRQRGFMMRGTTQFVLEQVAYENFVFVATAQT